MSTDALLAEAEAIADDMATLSLAVFRRRLSNAIANIVTTERNPS